MPQNPKLCLRTEQIKILSEITLTLTFILIYLQLTNKQLIGVPHKGISLLLNYSYKLNHFLITQNLTLLTPENHEIPT